MTTIILALLGLFVAGFCWLVTRTLAYYAPDRSAGALAAYRDHRHRFAPSARRIHSLIAPARATRDA